MARKDTRTHRGRNGDRGMQYYSGQYVYYHSLPKYYPALAGGVHIRFSTQVREATNLTTIAAEFGQMSAAELTKETALLREKFGTNIEGEYGNENFAKNLITAINSCLGIKEIFERNLALIKESSGGQKNIMSYFPTYFKRVWEENAQQIYDDTVATFTGADQLTLDNAFADAVNAKLPELVEKAVLIMMRESGVETGIHNNRDQYQEAYQTMAAALENHQAGAETFINAFIQNYHLQEIVNLIREGSDINNLVGKKDSDFNVYTQFQQRSGLTMEQVRTYMENIIFEGLAAAHGSDSIKVDAKAYDTGATKMKSDITTVLGIPFDTIEQWFNNSDFGNREKNVKAALDLQQQLNKFNDGFITYTNAKNYTLNNSFENGGTGRMAGFSAGSPISLETFSSIMDVMGMGADNLVRNCMQLIPGAIGDDQMGAAETMMARMIATALFDDFNVIGSVETGGAQSIHLLDLNGVLLPLSFYLWLLSDAFSQVSNLADTNLLVSVNIETPSSVEYDEPAPPGFSQEYWDNQRNIALNGIKISWHFLAGFKSIMQQFMS